MQKCYQNNYANRIIFTPLHRFLHAHVSIYSQHLCLFVEDDLYIYRQRIFIFTTLLYNHVGFPPLQKSPNKINKLTQTEQSLQAASLLNHFKTFGLISLSEPGEFHCSYSIQLAGLAAAKGLGCPSCKGSVQSGHIKLGSWGTLPQARNNM